MHCYIVSFTGKLGFRILTQHKIKESTQPPHLELSIQLQAAVGMPKQVCMNLCFSMPRYCSSWRTTLILNSMSASSMSSNCFKSSKSDGSSNVQRVPDPPVYEQVCMLPATLPPRSGTPVVPRNTPVSSWGEEAQVLKMNQYGSIASSKLSAHWLMSWKS